MGATTWQECLHRLEQEIPSHEFTTYIRPLQATENQGEIRLLAPNRYILDQVNGLFLGKIQSFAKNFGVDQITVHIGSSELPAVGIPSERCLRHQETVLQTGEFYPL